MQTYNETAELEEQEDMQPIETEEQKSARMEEIEKFALIIKEKRKDAIEARRASGVEEQWQEDEDAYEGVDDYNRKTGGYTKARNSTGGLQEAKKAPSGRSTVIPNITRPYCDAASARVADMLLPTDDRNWAIRTTPNPTLVNNVDNPKPAVGMDGVPMMKPAPAPQQQPAPPGGMINRIGGAIAGVFGGQQQAQAPATPTMQPVTVGELAQQTIDAAKKSAERAQIEIDDWLVEGRYHAEIRKVIERTSRVGVGILKGPVPAKKRTRIASNASGSWALQMEIKTSPTSVAVNHWNFYPDGNCGNDIQNGTYCFEYDDITARGLRELKGEGYINEMIDLCLTEGPIRAVDGTRHKEGQATNDKDLFEIWYFHGTVSKKDMEAAGCKCENEDNPAIVTMVNDRIIKITMSPLDSGEFPYDVMVWQNKLDSWAGIGVARQICTPQISLTSAVRALQDNMALSSGPQIIIDSSLIEPANGRWSITPNKIWRKKINTEALQDVRKAFTIVSIETRQVEILNVIRFWIKEAEDVTGLPMLLQGQQGGAPETLGATQIVNNNGSSVLRRIARIFDDRITERHIGRYYEWLLLHGPEDAKGDMQIDARGSSALVERDIQNQAMMQLLGASLNPAYKLDPEKVAKEVMKGMRLDHKNFGYDEEQKKAMAEQKPPEDPRITAAKILAASREKLEQMDDKDNADHALAEAQLQLNEQRFLERENELDRQNAQVIATINERMQTTQLSSKERETLAKIKATLAETSAKLATQRDLSVAGHKMTLHQSQAIKPPSEPVGRAEKGHAFTQ